MANGKAVDADELPAELLKHLLNDDTRLSSIQNIIVDSKRRPRVSWEWNDATIAVILKKKDETECNRYRELYIMVKGGKVLLVVFFSISSPAA